MMAGSDIHPSRLSLGTKVNLITGAQYRYEGVVAAINSIDGTLTLQNVRFWGTENRLPSGKMHQNNAENKAPAVGTVFDSITFWMSSIMQLWSADEERAERNDLGDKGVVKAGMTMGRSHGSLTRRSRNWWSTGDSRPMMRESPSHGSDVMPIPMRRYSNPPSVAPLSGQPRMLVSYPRRGRNGGVLPRQSNYVPMVPVISGNGTISNGMTRRSGYGSGPNRGSSYRMSTTPAPGVSSFNGRGMVPVVNGGSRLGMGSASGRMIMNGGPMRRVGGNGDERRGGYGVQNEMAEPGGLFVYLPPEMAAAYQSHGINLVPARSSMQRRRMMGRRGTPRGQSTSEPEVDCTTPYDFETANAELEAELAKISLNSDETATTGTGVLEVCSGLANQTSISSSSDPNGDIQAGEIRTCHSPTTTETVLVGSGRLGNGASGDSSLGAVTVSVGEVASSMESHLPLAKGEYYVREKCFFDQISRSETNTRNSYPPHNNPRGSYHPGTYSNSYQSAYTGPINSTYGSGSGIIVSSAAAAARRERQLNMETFGPMAARATFVPRRRPTGTLPREYLVSASA